jgi:hypothetical protein
MGTLKDIEVIKIAMQAVGFRLVELEVGPMDSGSVDFSDGTRTIRIGKDRGQWSLTGSPEKLMPLGLWKAFDDTSEFREALLSFIKGT